MFKLRLCLLSLLLFAAACAAGERAAPGLHSIPATQLMPFPRHETADLTEYVLAGKDAESRSSGALELGSALELNATAGDFQFAVFRFNPTTESPDSVSVLLEEAVTTGAWIGLADYTAERWEFSGPFVKQKTLVADDPAYLSPAGNIWVAVVVPAGESALVNALSVRTITANNVSPTAAMAADVTSGAAPLTVSFDASASVDEGSITEYAWDFDGDGLYDGFSDSPQVSHVYSTSGLVTAKVRVTDDQLARDFATIEIDVLNAAPIANLLAGATKIEPGETVLLFAGGSHDSDGTIAQYEWDLDGDNSFSEAGAEADALGDPIVSLVGGTPQALSIQLKVTDNDGAQDTAALEITVRGWLVVPVSSLFVFNGGVSSLALIDGKPAMSFVNGASNTLHFAYSSSVDGSSGWSDVQVSPDLVNGSGVSSLALIDGKPAISFVNATTETLHYARSGTSDGSSGWSDLAASLDFVSNTGTSSLALINGKPAISYVDGAANALHYAHSSTADGSSGWSDVEVSPAFMGGDAVSSLALVNGKPAISYRSNVTSTLHYAHSSMADGSSGWLDVEASLDFLNSNAASSLALVNGTPGISYIEGSSNTLRFAYSSLTDGSGGWTSTLVSSDFLSSEGVTSLAVVNGLPAISYINVASNTLQYAHSSAVDGSTGWMEMEVSPEPIANGTIPSLAMVNNRAAISFIANSVLKYAVFFE